MYYRLDKKELDKIFSQAIKETGGIMILRKKLDIPKSVLYRYRNGENTIPENILNKILFISKNKINEKSILKILPDNWRQVKGGRNCVKKKKIEGTLNKQLVELHKASSIFMKKYHKEWKEKDPERYYNSQYGKFKKIAGYKYITQNGEKVRNLLEKQTADNLKERGLAYRYEPLIRIGKRAFFPDFLVNEKMIIECTMWRGYDKAIKLREKIKFLENKYKVFVLIPKALNNYYGILNSHVVFELPDNMSP